MKKFIPALALMFILASCNNDSNSSNNISDTATQGTWRVTLFSERGVDETSDFNGYTFTFSSGGGATAVNGGTTKTGSWTVDNSSNKFIINFGPKDNTNRPLGQLTDDWLIQSVSSNKISLRDDNSGSNEILEFTKN